MTDKEKLKRTKKALLIAVKALSFYADIDTYFAIGFFPDPPCGDFMKDFDKSSKKPGKRARRAFEKMYALYENETP